MILLAVMGRISEGTAAAVPSEIRPKIGFLERTPVLLLVTGAAGRTAGGRLFGGLVTGTAGRTASGGLLSRLITGTAGRAASSGLLSGLVASAASGAAGSRRGGLCLAAPVGEIGKSHLVFLLIVSSNRFSVCKPIVRHFRHQKKYALFYYPVTKR